MGFGSIQLARRFIIENHSSLSCRQLSLAYIARRFTSTSQDKMICDEKAESNCDRSIRSILLPPNCVRGMKQLDVDKFTKDIQVPCISVPCDKISKVMPIVKKHLLKMRKINPVQSVEETATKKIILDPVKTIDFAGLDEKLKSVGVNSELSNCNLRLGYDNWNADEVFKAVLPPDQDNLSSFSVIGHIYHVNLRDHLLDYRELIGKVLLDKNTYARTVVNKLNSIDSTYRTFQIEILAGDDDMMAKVRENQCVYEFDFSKVYWNPRLGGEHDRIVQKLKENDVLYDVFAGVGPFSIPAAKKRCTVLANDLNPESYKWLQHNIKLNKVADMVTTYNKDGGDFIREDLRSDLLKQWKSEGVRNYHITMNLPAMAVEFLKHFQGLFALEQKPPNFKSPTVHVYCFTKGADDPESAAKELAEMHFGSKLCEDLKEVFHVRNVSNKKEMMRVSFALSENVLFDNVSDSLEPASKKAKVSDEC